MDIEKFEKFLLKEGKVRKSDKRSDQVFTDGKYGNRTLEPKCNSIS